MQQICLSLLCGLGLHLILLCCAEEGLEFPNFDGKDRVLDVNERNYKKALRRFDLLCLFYHEPVPANKGLQKRFQMTELVLEVRRRVSMETWGKKSVLCKSCTNVSPINCKKLIRMALGLALVKYSMKSEITNVSKTFYIQPVKWI